VFFMVLSFGAGSLRLVGLTNLWVVSVPVVELRCHP
jgi:hypothetical protein